MNLLPQTYKKRELTSQQNQFLELLFENGGQVTAAAVDAGYSRGSAAWLKSTLADEIIEQINHNVTAIHGVVLLPPKKEVVIDG